ncbi:MAG: tetratricopeptide repeat protein [Myxococcales bacterium]|nr:tetratricopeptide repeat protein [Myxococcales bacterium]
MSAAHRSPGLEDQLERLGQARAEDPPGEEARKQGIKARLFGDPTPPSERFGRFVDLGPLGHGAMGTVRRAYDARLAREVAIKVVRDRSGRRPNDRLLREAQALAQLSHPNVVQVYESGEIDGEIFIAMELVDGTPLDAWQRERHAWRECLEVYVQAGRGLAAAHEAGLVHRDFKPSNCIRDRRGRVRVLDFGLARSLEVRETSGDSAPAEAASTTPWAPAPRASLGSTDDIPMLQVQLTANRAVVGTLAYMAPEQYAGRGVDARSDQFAFCVSLFEAIYGEPPFGRDPRAALVEMMGCTGRAPTFPSSPSVPAVLRRALQRGMAGDPAARWPSMEALLGQLVGPLRPTAWRSLSMMGVLGLGVGLASTAFGGGEDHCAAVHERVEHTWNQEHREQVEAALLATGAPYARTTARTVRAELDRYASRLDEELYLACRAEGRTATSSPRPAVARLACLDAREAALQDVVQQLRAADEPLAAQAVDLVMGLPPVEGCDSPAPEPVLASPEDQPEVRRIGILLDRARARIDGARLDQAQVLAEEALEAAEAIDAPGLQAEARLVQGRALLGRGKADQARTVLEEARVLAQRHGTDEILVGVLSSLSHVVGVSQGRHDLGLVHAADAVSFADRPQVSGRMRAVAHAAHGNLSVTHGELEEARGHFERALQGLEAEHQDGLALVEPLDGLAITLRHQGSYREAIAHGRRALRILQASKGDLHPDTAISKANLAAILGDQGELGEARRLYEEAIAGLEHARGLDPFHLAAAHNGLAAILAEQGEPAGAELHYLAAIERWSSATSPDPRAVATARANLARLLATEGEHEAALEQLRPALAALEGLARTPRVVRLQADVLRGLGRAHRERGELETAEAYFRAGLEQLEREGGEASETMASLLNGLGRLRLRQGDAAEAMRLHLRALELARTDPAVSSDRIPRTHYYLAQALAALGRRSEAAEHADHAVAGGVEDAHRLRDELAAAR